MLEVRGIISRSLSKAIFLLLVGMLFTAGFQCPALSQIAEISPNGIAYLGEADTLTAGETYDIIVQILYAGGPLKSEGVRVYFLANDTSVLPAELGTYVLTDPSGNATFSVTPGKAGDVKLTAMALSTNSGVSVDKKFHVIEEAVATPTAMPSPTPTPVASATPTAVPTAEPTLTATPTVAPIVTSAPTGQPPSGDANAQATGILASGIVIAAILLVLVSIARVFRKK
jgi:hypothetical protein